MLPRFFQKSFLRITNKLRSLVIPKEDHGKMLTMHLKKTLYHQTQKPDVPLGYIIRNYHEKDYWQVCMLYIKTNIGFCDIDYFKPNILTNAHKLIADENTGRIVGSVLGTKCFRKNDGRYSKICKEWLAT